MLKERKKVYETNYKNKYGDFSDQSIRLIQKENEDLDTARYRAYEELIKKEENAKDVIINTDLDKLNTNKNDIKKIINEYENELNEKKKSLNDYDNKINEITDAINILSKIK